MAAWGGKTSWLQGGGAWRGVTPVTSAKRAAPDASFPTPSGRRKSAREAARARQSSRQLEQLSGKGGCPLALPGTSGVATHAGRARAEHGDPVRAPGALGCAAAAPQVVEQRSRTPGHATRPARPQRAAAQPGFVPARVRPLPSERWGCVPAGSSSGAARSSLRGVCAPRDSAESPLSCAGARTPRQRDLKHHRARARPSRGRPERPRAPPDAIRERRHSNRTSRCPPWPSVNKPPCLGRTRGPGISAARRRGQVARSGGRRGAGKQNSTRGAKAARPRRRNPPRAARRRERTRRGLQSREAACQAAEAPAHA
jgi:hypothetical protein